MTKGIVSVVASVGLFLGCVLWSVNVKDHESEAKNGHSTHLKSSKSASEVNKREQKNEKETLSAPDNPNQKFIYISPNEKAPPKVANAYATEGKEGKVQSLPNVNPDIPIVIMKLPNRSSTK